MLNTYLRSYGTQLFVTIKGIIIKACKDTSLGKVIILNLLKTFHNESLPELRFYHFKPLN